MLGSVDDGIEGSVVTAGRIPRATAISNFARELGLDFTDVQCRTSWARMLTRQDAWDYSGRDQAEEDLADDHACPTCAAPRGAACNEDGDAEPCAERLALVPDEPPSDWQPEMDEYTPAWETCKPDEPRAVKVWLLEERRP